jgi:hypothetical protein
VPKRCLGVAFSNTGKNKNGASKIMDTLETYHPYPWLTLTVMATSRNIEFAVNNIKDPAMLTGGNLIAVVFFLEQSNVSKQVRRCPQFGMLFDGIICASSQFGHSLHQLPKDSACKIFHTFLFYMFSIILVS